MNPTVDDFLCACTKEWERTLVVRDRVQQNLRLPDHSITIGAMYVWINQLMDQGHIEMQNGSRPTIRLTESGSKAIRDIQDRAHQDFGNMVPA